jgi:hypothetical protein
MQFTRIKEMLDSLGPDNPGIDEAARHGESEWLVAFDGDLSAVIEWAEDPPRLVLSSPVGRPPVDRRFVVYESLLSFNMLWRDNGGCRIALNGADGEVVVLLDLIGEEVTPSTLHDALTGFAEVAAQWTAYVGAAPTSFSLPPPHPMMLAGLLA